MGFDTPPSILTIPNLNRFYSPLCQNLHCIVCYFYTSNPEFEIEAFKKARVRFSTNKHFWKKKKNRRRGVLVRLFLSRIQVLCQFTEYNLIPLCKKFEKNRSNRFCASFGSTQGQQHKDKFF